MMMQIPFTLKVEMFKCMIISLILQLGTSALEDEISPYFQFNIV